MLPSILAFDVNESLLNIQHLAPRFERLFGDGKLLNERYTQVILRQGAIYTILQAALKSMGSIYGIPIQHADLVELEM
ncbi:hypothetical protein CDS [Bradyrhizobium sp.]|nr:hypothetical protein CDS [Bradyrhizobium sp.]